MQQQSRPNNQAPRVATQQNPQQSNVGQGSSAIGPCFSCGEKGHLANRCLKKKQQGAPQQNAMRGGVNHVTLEDAQSAPDMVIGMFPVNSNPATVLFDSGATHSFISCKFIARNNLSVTLMPNML